MIKNTQPDGSVRPKGSAGSQRPVFIVLSRHSFDYAALCFQSLVANSLDPLSITLLVDDEEDKTIFATLMEETDLGFNSARILTKKELDGAAELRLSEYPSILGLREGHPCWRKITDPLLLSADGEEVIVLDPDLYFPNKFHFEVAPERGVFLMHQKPNCLFPPRAVRRAFEKGYQLARHVDIGVAQYCVGGFDIKWLDTFLKEMAPADFNRFMHIEAIVWSAIAIKFGGLYLDRSVWRCWQKGYFKRLALVFGVHGVHLLRLEQLSTVKCIHISGQSKWWALEAKKRGVLIATNNTIAFPTQGKEYVELSKARYEYEQFYKALVPARLKAT
ncbi:MAG: hypothetical protein AAGA38_02090 [Pseudomonadota bacterium]